MNEHDKYKPNSHKYKNEQMALAAGEKKPEDKKIEKVVTGAVKTKKKSEARKLADVFVAEDMSSVGSFILNDVVVPAIKKLIYDAGKNALEMSLFGGPRRGDRDSHGAQVSYRQYYDNDRFDDRPRARARLDFDDLTFTNRGDAERVLDEMIATVRRYGLITVADMYEMAGERPPYTSNNYGWMSLRGADVERCRDGYYLRLPKAQPID